MRKLRSREHVGGTFLVFFKIRDGFFPISIASRNECGLRTAIRNVEQLLLIRLSVINLRTRDGPIRKFHYSAEAEYLMNATEAEASAEYFLPFWASFV